MAMVTDKIATENIQKTSGEDVNNEPNNNDEKTISKEATKDVKNVMNKDKKKSKPSGPVSSNSDRRRIRDEKRAKKTIIEEGVTGKVKWYNVPLRYGFIARDDNPSQDIFVHQRAISKSSIYQPNLRSLDKGEEVLFDIVQGKQGLEAANVTGPNRTNVRGNMMAGFILYRHQIALDRDRMFGRYRNRRPLMRDGGRRANSLGISPGDNKGDEAMEKDEKQYNFANVGKENTRQRNGNQRRYRGRRRTEGDKESVNKKDASVQKNNTQKDQNSKGERSEKGRKEVEDARECVNGEEKKQEGVCEVTQSDGEKKEGEVGDKGSEKGSDKREVKSSDGNVLTN